MTSNLAIDMGYFLHFRYYAALAWYKRAHPDLNLSEVDIQQQDKFQTTLAKRVRETIEKLVKTHKVEWNNVFYCNDCSQKDIWRNTFAHAYKQNRNIKDVKIGFGLIYRTIQEMSLNNKGHIISHPQAEADDIVYCLKLTLQSDDKLIIIASDNDYYQLCDEQTELLRLDKRSAMNKSLGNPNKDLKYKIILGDPSDNIPGVFPKCGPKTALKWVEDPEAFQKKLDTDREYQERYQYNCKMIDMSYIPQDIQTVVRETIHQFKPSLHESE